MSQKRKQPGEIIRTYDDSYYQFYNAVKRIKNNMNNPVYRDLLYRLAAAFMECDTEYMKKNYTLKKIEPVWENTTLSVAFTSKLTGQIVNLNFNM